MVALAPTQSAVLTALRSFLFAILPAGIEVVEGLDNRVPEPAAADFVVMTPILRGRLSTNVDTFDATSATVTEPTQVTVQLDVHGPNSGDNSQVIFSLMRDLYATTFFAAQDGGVTPFYAGDPRQMPFENENQQIENRWVIDAVMQINAAVTGIPQQSADTLSVTTINVEATYP